MTVSQSASVNWVIGPADVDAGVVDQDVDRAEGRLHLAGQPVDVGQLGHVGGKSAGAAAGGRGHGWPRRSHRHRASGRASATSAPASARAVAIVKPRPRAPPVTRAILPSSRKRSSTGAEVGIAAHCIWVTAKIRLDCPWPIHNAREGFVMTRLRLIMLARGVAVGGAARRADPDQRAPLEIYVVDTEGGKATLFISPSGESLLIDSGNPGGRDTRPDPDAASGRSGSSRSTT